MEATGWRHDKGFPPLKKRSWNYDGVRRLRGEMQALSPRCPLTKPQSKIQMELSSVMGIRNIPKSSMFIGVSILNHPFGVPP